MNDCPFRYQGQYQDEETGLYYNRFRYYDPNVGNYISKDPIGLAGGNPTLYGYVRDSNGWVDPWGLEIAPFGTTLFHYTSQTGMEGIVKSNAIKPSSGDIHARFGDGQYFTDISPNSIGGRTIKDLTDSTKISQGQLAANIYGDARKLNSVSNYVEIDVSGLDVSQPRPGTFLINNTENLDITERIKSYGSISH